MGEEPLEFLFRLASLITITHYNWGLVFVQVSFITSTYLETILLFFTVVTVSQGKASTQELTAHLKPYQFLKQ